jgi:hypothetical protein
MKEKIFQKYEEFVKFEVEDISDRLLKLPEIVAYYQEIYFSVSKKLQKLRFELDKKWQERFLYYKTEFNISLSSSEIKTFIERDLEYIDIKEKIAALELLLTKIEEVLKALDNMRWTIKSLIDWEKFKAGDFH